MKRTILIAAIVFLVFAGNALAWHANGVTVVAPCDAANHIYKVTASVDQSKEWPGAFVKSITPDSFPGATSGPQSVVVVVAWSNQQKQTFNTTITLDGTCVAPTAEVVCPPDFPTNLGTVGGILRCGKTTTITNTVTNTVTVPGPTQTVTKTIPVPGPTVTVVKWKTKVVNHRVVRYKVKTRVVRICPIKHFEPKLTG